MHLIYISPVFWNSYCQRPHFMVRYFLACGGRDVLWINPYPGRLPKLSDLRRSIDLHDQGTSSHPPVRVFNFRALPIEPLPGGSWFNKQVRGRHLLRKVKEFAGHGDCILGIGKPCALALDLLRVPYRWTFYDAMDDFPNFHRGLSRRSMARLESAICSQVKEAFVSSTFLKEKFLGGLTPVTCIRNACNPAALPTPNLNKGGARQVFGYIGSVGDWFDWDCVFALAKAVPFGELRLVGPHLVPPPRNLPPNVKIFPACRHDEIERFLSEFSVGLIPFKKTPLTKGVDPIKFYEYRAVGLPVLSTSFGEMALRKGEPGLFFLDDRGGIDEAVQAALSYHSQLEDLTRWRADNSWSARFAKAGLFHNLFPSEHVV